ncbi:MAG: HlyD family type I secretion periplasmic adaptor subunit [Pseudomonadota bacterium]
MKKTFKTNKLKQDELIYANAVDAALNRKPTRQARLLSFLVLCFFATMITWAYYAEIDEVTHAEGKVVASQRTQTIQNLEGGILQEVLVQEGDIVDIGTPLARLNNAMAQSSHRDIELKVLEQKAAIIRLSAELRDLQQCLAKPQKQKDKSTKAQTLHEELIFPEDLCSQAPQIIAEHAATYQANQVQRRSEFQMLESQYRQRLREIDEQRARQRNLRRRLSIAIEQRDIAYPLMKRRTFSRVDYLALEQEVVTLNGELSAIKAAIPRTMAAAKEAEQRMDLRAAEIKAALTIELNQHKRELASLVQSLHAGTDRLTRTELRSPVHGIIKLIYRHSAGSVIKPGESILDIVPLDDTLVIEARIRPSDVAFLHAGQKAMIKFSAYDFSIYGGLPASLEHISADTVEDNDSGRRETYYLIKLRTTRNSIDYKGQSLPIMAGMVVTADILTGRKSVLDYLLKPILKAKQNALTER